MLLLTGWRAESVGPQVGSTCSVGSMGVWEVSPLPTLHVLPLHARPPDPAPFRPRLHFPHAPCCPGEGADPDPGHRSGSDSVLVGALEQRGGAGPPAGRAGRLAG